MTRTKTTLLLLATITIVLATIPSASAKTTVSVAPGSSTPGCEEAMNCFGPDSAKVVVGETVTWSNDDTAAHTVTSGTASSGPDGEFDSGLFMAGTTFSHIFEKEGMFDYFCMVHPWMTGSISVGEASAEEVKDSKMSMPEKTDAMVPDDKEKFNLKNTMTTGKVTSIYPDTSANSLIVDIETTNSGSLTITLPRDIIDAKMNGADDDFFVLVDGEEVDFEETKTNTERTLTIPFTETTEEIEIIGTFVVPEFGTVALVILAAAVVSVIAISARTKFSIVSRP